MIDKVLAPRFVRNQNTPMTEHQYAELKAFAKAKGVNCADVMRTALAMFMTEHGDKND